MHAPRLRRSSAKGKPPAKSWTPATTEQNDDSETAKKNARVTVDASPQREFWQILDDVIAALVELGDIRKRGPEIIHDGMILTPQALRKYLASRCVFISRMRTLKRVPFPIPYAVLSRACNGHVPVPDDAGATP